jgi:hypothetical protein
MTAKNLYSGHPDVPRPSNEELLSLTQKVIDAIEVCGASPALTHAVVLAIDLKNFLCKTEPTLVLNIDFEDDTSCEITVHGTSRNVNRLKTRIDYWIQMEALVASSKI